MYLTIDLPFDLSDGHVSWLMRLTATATTCAVRVACIAYVVCVAVVPASAQTFVDVPTDAEHWLVEGPDARIETYRGVPSIYLAQGYASLRDVSFTDGIIEFDMMFPEARGFPGIQFRVQTADNHEEFYFRPHQSGNPDANQYTPAFNGLAGWQLYFGEQYSFATAYDFDVWVHVKLVVSGQLGEIYLGDEATPDVTFHLKRPVQSGGIAFQGGAEVRFANLRYAKQSGIRMKGTPKPFEPLPASLVRRWQISSGFNETTLGVQLTAAQMAHSSWQALDVDPEGSINIGKIVVRSDEANTVFARVLIDAQSAGIHKFSFGYSDRAYVYLNGDLLYSGDNGYFTRDYRYLGTIGLFDNVYLPLRAGRNELWIAVSEDFGGWGLTGLFEDMRGITVVN